MRAPLIATLVFAALTIPSARADRIAPCADRFGTGAECGHVTVFEDRAAGKGRQIELDVVVLRATGGTSAEPVFLLAGGPGQAATDLVGASMFLGQVRRVRDIVLVDQRGTGDSNPLMCPTRIKTDPASAFGGLWDPEAIGRCRKSLAKDADPTLYTTDHVVDDLDEVRRRLGYDKVLLWGGSGGTRTALVYMRRHPDRVVAAALDGVAPTDFRAPSGYARGCQDALDKVFADCAAQASCARAFPKLEADFAKVLGLFDKGPVATTVDLPDRDPVRIRMHRGDFTYAVRGILYNSLKIAGLPRMIHRAAETGDVSAFARAYWHRSADILPELAVGVHLSVFCAEDVPFLDDLDLDPLTRDTFVGDYLLDQYRAACDAWPAEPVDRSYLQPVRSEIPVLMFSGYYDPSTPASTADAVAAHLPNSRHVVARNESHGAGFGCGLELLVDFLDRGSLEGLGPACENAGPIVFQVGD